MTSPAVAAARIRLARKGAIVGDPGPQAALRYASKNGRQVFAIGASWPELADPAAITGIYHAAAQRERAQIKAMGRDLVVTRGFDALKPAAMVFEHVPLGPLAQFAIALGCKGPFWSIEADDLAGPTALLQALEDLADGRCDQAMVAAYEFDPPAARACLLVRDDAAPPLVWSARFIAGRRDPGRADLEAVAESLGLRAGALRFPAGAIADMLVPPCTPDPRVLLDPPGTPDPRDPPDLRVLRGSADHHGLDLAIAALEHAAAGEAIVVWRHTPDGRGLLLGLCGGGAAPGAAAREAAP
ncbi:MAG: hypothetical protein FJZ01_23465 [Candidatus Sericytochromatia bacterium]|nr:hypothetical protein [Candidatus Tanganyikabacteria bacterium]